MSLPELTLQFIYGRLAWAIVLAALIVALWPRSRPLSRGAIAIVLLGAVALNALPGPASPTYWLGLAAFWPSGLMLGLCLAKLQLAWQGERGRPVMAPALAAILAVIGAILYIDALGLTSMGLFYLGFGPNGAPAVALLLAVVCSVAIMRGAAKPQASALLVAVATFSVLRLPTGNLWDALLDPLLWAWSLAALIGAGWHWLSGKRPSRAIAPVQA